MNKKTFLVLVFSLILTFSYEAYADTEIDGSTKDEDAAWNIISCGDYRKNQQKSLRNLPNVEPNWEDSKIISRSANIRVTVQTPLEKSWINRFSQYYYQSNRIVERIDDYLASKFGIDFVTISQPKWTSINSKDQDKLLKDAKDKFGKGKADLMIAFAGPLADTDSFTLFGVASLSEPYAMLFDHSFQQNCKTCQHEVGHTYGLEHCKKACVMKQGWDTNWDLFDHLCSAHFNQWNKNKNKY